MGRFTILLIASLACALATACSMHVPSRQEHDAPTEELPILAVHSGAYSGFTRPIRLVVYDQRLLDQLPFQTRPVDFTREMVLFAGLGPAPSRQYGIEITGVERRGRRVHAQVVKFYPSQERGLEPGLASPFCAVVVSRCDWPVEGFEGRLPPEVVRGARGSGR